MGWYLFIFGTGMLFFSWLFARFENRCKSPRKTYKTAAQREAEDREADERMREIYAEIYNDPEVVEAELKKYRQTRREMREDEIRLGI